MMRPTSEVLAARLASPRRRFSPSLFATLRNGLVVASALFCLSSLFVGLKITRELSGKFTQPANFDVSLWHDSGGAGEVEMNSNDQAVAPTAIKKAQCAMLPNGGPVHVVWAWDTPPTVQAMKTTLEGMAAVLPRVQVNVYCGSMACVTAANAAKNKCVTVDRMVAPVLAEGSPLEDWVGDHILAKLLSAHYFEQTLQVAMQLVVLWKYGGVVVLAGSKPSVKLSTLLGKETTLLSAPGGGLVRAGLAGGLHGAGAPSANSIVRDLMVEMLVAYHWSGPEGPKYVSSDWPVKIKWEDICRKATGCSAASVSIEEMGVDFEGDGNVAVDLPPRHFGTLSYQARRHYLKSIGNPGMNVGDEMQGLAGIQFIPRLDAFVERDRLDTVNVISSRKFNATGPVTPEDKSNIAKVPTTVFFNAWWGTKTWVWPPPGKLEPILVAMHLNTQKAQDDVAKHKKYLDSKWPIGARDTKTETFFKSHGVHSLFSGCMTMTLLPSWSAKRAAAERTNEVLIVDVSDKALELIPNHIKANATFLTAKLLDERVDDQVARYIAAHATKIRFQKAKLVITQRLHVALPSASMGTPVILILDVNLPGGGGAAGLARFSGLQAAAHTVDAAEGSKALANFNWDKPPPNPNPEVIELRRNALRVLAMCHGELSDSAHKFGVIPSSWEYPIEDVTCNKTEDDSDDRIHIAVALTSEWFDESPVFTTWIRAISKSNPGEKISFYFLTSGMNDKQRCLVRWITLRWLPGSKVYTIQMDDSLSQIEYKGLTHVPKITQARLYLPRLLPCVHRSFWIDLDALVIQPLRQLWTKWEKMPDCGIVARSSTTKNVVLDMLRNEIPHFKGTYRSDGFNAGVMLVDLEILRATKFTETLAQYWSFDLGGNDQIALNMQCNGTHGELDSTWNVFKGYSSDPVNKRFDEWGIVHFQGSLKAWNSTAAAWRDDPKHYKIWMDNTIPLRPGVECNTCHDDCGCGGSTDTCI
jgi:lipopolysaccharide biosynthesis glycosyltransferase